MIFIPIFGHHQPNSPRVPRIVLSLGRREQCKNGTRLKPTFLLQKEVPFTRVGGRKVNYLSASEAPSWATGSLGHKNPFSDGLPECFIKNLFIQSPVPLSLCSQVALSFSRTAGRDPETRVSARPPPPQKDADRPAMARIASWSAAGPPVAFQASLSVSKAGKALAPNTREGAGHTPTFLAAVGPGTELTTESAPGGKSSTARAGHHDEGDQRRLRGERNPPRRPRPPPQPSPRRRSAKG